MVGPGVAEWGGKREGKTAMNKPGRTYCKKGQVTSSSEVDPRSKDAANMVKYISKP